MAVSISSLTTALNTYKLRPGSGPVTLATLPIVEDRGAGVRGHESDEEADSTGNTVAAADTVAANKDTASGYAEALYKVPEFSDFGPVVRSSRPIPLTEDETEYVVNCVKHVFAEHVVFQFNITNTLDDQRLANVSVMMEAGQELLLEEVAVVPAPAVAYRSDTPGVCYVAMQRNVDAGFPSVSFMCEMKFDVIDVDAATG